MTHKENITAILECYFTGFKKEIINSACDRILEQEPTKEELALLQKWRDNRGVRMEDFEDAMNALQESTPQPKTGHWIEHKNNGMTYIECSECSSWFLRMYLTRNSYCPNCGTKMVEPPEGDK